jgi:hypothetical protein
MSIDRHLNRLLLIMFSFVSIGCEELIVPPVPLSNPTAIFEHLWKDVNNRYSFFNEKEVNWLAVKHKYAPKISSDMSEHELFEVLGDMLAELRDGHVNLLSTFNRSRNWIWYQGFPLYYNQQIIEQVYLGTDFRIIGPMQVQSLDNILYVNYRTFENSVTERHMDEIVRLMRSHDGLIVDVRSNGGGNLQNAQRIVARFIEQDLIYARERFKSGPGHNDFTSWASLRVEPSPGEKYLGKIAVLTNRRSYSTTTFFAQMMKILPQARLFGDQTGGGGGIPVFAELPNGWTYRFSASQTTDLNGNHLEFGVEVDDLLADPRRIVFGRDHFIDTAITWLKGQSE